jgi:hypothetical protein
MKARNRKSNCGLNEQFTLLDETAGGSILGVQD